jgi:hypothetical protein
MEIGEADAFGMKAVDVGRLEDRIAMTRKVAVTLVVGQDENDVGLLAGDRFGGNCLRARCDECKNQKSSEHFGT